MRSQEKFKKHPFLLAPMAGVTDAAYRIMCRRRGCAWATSEMVSVAGLAYGSAKTWELLLPAEEEQQITVQLFGSRAEQFERASAAVVERLGTRLSAIDINMACPARKVFRKGEGAALMELPEQAASIVASCVRGAAGVPVTVKMRAGVQPEALLAPEFAARLEQAGAAAVAVHGRYATQLYQGAADWSVIDEVAARISIPTIGSGDVFSAGNAVRMLRDTAARAVFIARGSYGTPWIFEDARTLLSTGEPAPERTPEERLDALQEHLDLTHILGLPMRRARTYAPWYLRGLPNAAAWRARAVSCETHADFTACVEEIRASL